MILVYSLIDQLYLLVSIENIPTWRITPALNQPHLKCGRYVSPNEANQECFWNPARINWIVDPPKWCYAYPTKLLPIVTNNGPFVGRRWLIKAGLKRIGILNASNASIERAEFSSTYSHVQHTSQCCLVPMKRYYEWASAGKKQPYFVRSPKENVIYVCGLFELAGGKLPLPSTIIT